MSLDPNAHDRFILRQLIRPVVNRYEFSLPTAEDEAGEPFCFVEQKRFKFKEDIRFFADDSKQQETMRILARQAFDPRARYDVTDAQGAKIGEIQKVFGASLFRSTYALFDASGEEVGVGVVAEGVEDAHHVTALASIGIRHAQGHHFGRPAPLERLLTQVV